MKKSILLLFILTILACSKEDDPIINSPVYGEWRLSNINLSSGGHTFSIGSIALLAAERSNTSQSNVLECYESISFTFTERDFVISKNEQNSFCASNIDSQSGTYSISNDIINFNPGVGLISIDDVDVEFFNFSIQNNNSLTLNRIIDEIEYEMTFIKIN